MNCIALPAGFPSRWLREPALSALRATLRYIKDGAARPNCVPTQRVGTRNRGHGPLLLALLACLPAAASADTGRHVFTLHGGHFFGPGPIVPDTALPDGSIRNISFDLAKLEGVAAFGEGGKILSDGKTVSNANIDAGALEIGGKQSELKSGAKAKTEGKTFWLYAVAGGPNGGRETYRFDANYNMVWTVDIGLDPGFAEGILRVNGFELTTGIRKVPLSMQSAAGKPGGYDKAGSFKSGSLLVGRVGDFDADGFMDGTIVASANVPMQADLLPGAPVANKRGFKTDVAIDPLFAMELTLHGIANMRPLVKDTLNGGHLDQLTEYLKDVQERLLAARGNYDAAFIKTPAAKRAELQDLGWRLDSIKQMIYIPVAFLTTYNFPSGNAPWTVGDATTRAFDKAQALASLLEKRRGGHAPAAVKSVSTKNAGAKK